MYHRTKYKTENFKAYEKNIRENLNGLGFGDDF